MTKDLAVAGKQNHREQKAGKDEATQGWGSFLKQMVKKNQQNKTEQKTQKTQKNLKLNEQKIPQTEQLCTEEATTKLCLEHGGKRFVSVGRWRWKQAALQCLGGTEQAQTRASGNGCASSRPPWRLRTGCVASLLESRG